MSQAGSFGNTGGGGDITAVVGQSSLVAPTVTVTTVAGTATVEDRSWETQYVVDSSVTQGLRGTFSTIQAALNQAVADGMLYTSPRKIIIRTGSYTENLAIPGGAFFESAGYMSDAQAAIPFVTITGNHTLADICEWGSNGIQWTCPSGDLFTTGSTFALCLARNSTFNNAGTGKILQATTGTTILDWYDCQFLQGATPFSATIIVGSMNSCVVRNCVFNGTGWQVISGALRIEDCKDVGEINLGGSIFASNCNFLGGAHANIYGTGDGRIFNCGFNNNDSANYGFDATGGATMIGCYMGTGVNCPRDIINPARLLNVGFAQVGNVLKAIRTDVNYIVSSNGENYVGVTDTSAARSIQLRRGQGTTLSVVDYQIYVVDESGAAETNNITVTDVDGALINGAASYVIDQNFGAALFHTDGTDWYVTSSSKDLTYTPDVGGKIAPVGNLNVNGAESGTSNTPILNTHNVAGNLIVEPRAYNTQYVVDPSSTVGERGTYATIQSAIDAAVADGMAFNNQKMIYVRIGTYTEDLTIAGGTILVGETISRPTGGGFTPIQNTRIIGAHTLAGNAICAFNNLLFVTTTGDTFNGTGSAVCYLFFDNCTLAQLGADEMITDIPVSSYISINDCTLTGTGDAQVITLTQTVLNINNSKFEQPMNITVDSQDFFVNNTQGIGFVQLTNGGSITAQDCTFNLGATRDYNIDASVSGNQGMLRNCYFSGGAVIAAISAASGSPNWLIQNCGTGVGLGLDSRLYANTCNVNGFGVSQQGNLINSVRTATNFNMEFNHYYVGVTSTAAARTINLPDGNGSVLPGKDQSFIIKDESGAAGTNNITVTTQGGTVTIDGAVTNVINTNYGKVKVIFDGTNYFTI